MPKKSVSLNDLVRLDQQLQRDRETPLRQLQERDRAVGAPLRSEPKSRKLLAWLDNTAIRGRLPQLHNVEFSLGFWLGLAGLLIGLTAMSGLLLVDQQQPVNVLLFLTVFVGTQWLLLVLTLVVAFAVAMGGQLHLPLENLNPARWLFHRTFDRLAGNIRWEQFTPVVRLALLSWGQLFGVFFNIGLLAAMLIILSVVDRSFGWSSTMNISVEGLEAALRWLSIPWATWLPVANIDAQLVAATRYQSLQAQFGSAQVEAMRAWWPFLFACIAFYGLLPRAIMWLLLHYLYRRRLVRAFLHFPGVGMVLERMNSPLVYTQADGRETADRIELDKVALSALPANDKHFAINWAGALEGGAPDLLGQLNLSRASIASAGLNLIDDQKLLETINSQSAKQVGHDVIVLVKSWEPPLGELGDFLGGISSDTDCYLLLLPLKNCAIKPEEYADWQQFIRQQGHPRLALVSGSGGAAAEKTP
ncbi:MAG: DUF2868 domain-containing protein [Cellvibrionaceae bacterium]